MLFHGQQVNHRVQLPGTSFFLMVTMLTSDHAILELDDASGLVRPDRLSRKAHGHYLKFAQRLLQVYQRGSGRTRQELHREVENVCAALEDCPSQRIAAFCKLLDEVSVYDTDKRGTAAKLRQQVFSLAAPLHPLVSRPEGIFTRSETAAKQAIAKQLGMTWEEIDSRLFADVIEFQRLKEFSGYSDAAALLARYNVAQTQAALYRAESLHVWSSTDHKAILRYAKLARLMHSITRQRDGTYLFRFDGPASVLRRSTRYGIAMARLLPGLLSCRGWRAVAKVRDRRGRRYRLELSSEDGLNSPVAGPADFDSDWEAEFYQAWGETPREGWRLERETELLHQGQCVFTPDFLLVHESGQRVLLEIIGYWTPEYLLAKAKTIAKFSQRAMLSGGVSSDRRSDRLPKFLQCPILLAIPQQVQFDLPQGVAPPIVFKKSLKPEDVLQRLGEGLGDSGRAYQ